MVTHWLAELDGRRATVDVPATSANLGAGFFQGFVVSGVASRTALAAESAARTQLAGGVAAPLNLGGVAFATGAIAYLPLPVLGAACRDWQELGAAYEAARAGVLLAEAYRALGDEESAASEEALAKATFERLGVGWPAPEVPDGLTARECEVLALVVEGRSNRQIGEVLFISDRTVARHLTNIFHKIGVTSRTQAARYAIDHGMVAAR